MVDSTNKKAQQLVVQCKTWQHSSQSDRRISFLLTLVPKTFRRARESTRLFNLNATGTWNSHSRNAQTMAGQLELQSRGQEGKISYCLRNGKWRTRITLFENGKPFLNQLNLYQEISSRTLKHEHIYKQMWFAADQKYMVTLFPVEIF